MRKLRADEILVNACCHLVQNVFSSRLLSQTQRLKYKKGKTIPVTGRGGP
jgi:hypothetical protein